MFAIDINTCFGVQPTTQADYGLETLTYEMARHGIAAALTLSLRGYYDDHVSGNIETLAACRANSRLIPVAAINTMRGLGLAEDIAQIKAGGFRAVRLRLDVPFQYRPPDSLFFRRIFELLAPLHLPVMVSVNPSTEISWFARVAAEFDLPLVFLGPGSTDGELWAEIAEAARRYPGFYTDSSRIGGGGLGVMDRLVGEIGVEHLLYGSNLPFLTPQASLNAVFVSGLTSEEKAQVLYGNALQLFGLEETALQPQPEEAEFRGYAGPTIDVHTHINLGTHHGSHIPMDPASSLQQLRRFNIERAIASSWQGIAYDMVAGNREMKGAIDAHPELLGYVVVNPNYLERSCAEMDYYYRFDNFVGAKIHCPYSGQPTAGQPIRALLKEIARRGRPVLIHNDGAGWPEAIRDVAQEYPGLPIIIAHGGYIPHGGYTPALRELPNMYFDTPALRELPNVYFDFCISTPGRGNIRSHLDAVGAGRLLFGTDMDPLSGYDPTWSLGQYYDAELTTDEAKAIMYENAKRLFNL